MYFGQGLSHLFFGVEGSKSRGQSRLWRRTLSVGSEEGENLFPRGFHQLLIVQPWSSAMHEFATDAFLTFSHLDSFSSLLYKSQRAGIKKIQRTNRVLRSRLSRASISS